MILIALAGLCVLSVPLTGGRLSRLADVRLRGAWIPVLALTIQVVIIFAPGGSQSLDRALHIATYVLVGLFLWANRRLPGVPVIATGALLNAVAIVANGGVMPASETAERIAGMDPGPGFHNTVALAQPVLSWLGDIIPWPGPLSNVLSAGDVLIYLGTLVLVHRLCRTPKPAGDGHEGRLRARVPARGA